MLRHIPKPLNPRGLELHVRVKPARHRLVDDGLLLLVEHLDQAPLGPDEAVYCMTKESLRNNVYKLAG